jgi:hypothetical protein
MKKFLLLLILLFPALVWAQPVVEFRYEQHDFGVVRAGEMLEFNFELTNSGTDVLEIKSVNTS